MTGYSAMFALSLFEPGRAAVFRFNFDLLNFENANTRRCKIRPESIRIRGSWWVDNMVRKPAPKGDDNVS